MNTVQLIKKKCEKNPLSGAEIEHLINSYTNKAIPDYQFSAFLMAAFINGLNDEETSALTKAMLYSGEILNLDDIPGAKIDKHSTGGVGDKTSLILAPIVAAAGVNVPMISGRGLGHTGGTLDKLDSIHGFRTDLNLKEYREVISKCGAVLIGQTEEIAPADKLIYQLRDVTATVESIPLITASIMSKKLAEGIDGLVLDVKTGSGAFMKKYEDSKELALSLMNTAKAFDKSVIAFITDMNQPLGRYIGNWLEVYESVRVLEGDDSPELLEVSLNLSGAMIHLGGKAENIEEGIEISKELIANGKAYDKFLEIVKLQGGDDTHLKNPEGYPKPKFIEKVYAERDGYLEAIDTYQLGICSLDLGAGRMTKEDEIDPKAGIIFYPELGDKIKKGDLLAELHTDRETMIDAVKILIPKTLTLSDTEVERPELIKEILR